MASLHESLALDGSKGHYGRVIGGGWTFADRVFGGYTAALAATAARRESPHATLLALHVMFLEAARPGPLDLSVTELRRGRSTWAGHTVACQDGRPILTCDAWFGVRGAEAALPATPIDTTSPPGPDAHPSMDWLRELYPFLGVLEERAVDYPSSADESGGAPMHRGMGAALGPHGRRPLPGSDRRADPCRRPFARRGDTAAGTQSEPGGQP